MQTIQDIVRRFGISEKSVRRRLVSLGSMISPHLATGRQNATLFTDSAVAIFDRLLQLERQDSFSPSAAVKKLESELENGGAMVANHRGNTDQATPDSSTELVQVLTRQVRDLQTERDRLLSIIGS